MNLIMFKDLSLEVKIVARVLNYFFVDKSIAPLQHLFQLFKAYKYHYSFRVVLGPMLIRIQTLHYRKETSFVLTEIYNLLNFYLENQLYFEYEFTGKNPERLENISLDFNQICRITEFIASGLIYVESQLRVITHWEDFVALDDFRKLIYTFLFQTDKKLIDELMTYSYVEPPLGCSCDIGSYTAAFEDCRVAGRFFYVAESSIEVACRMKADKSLVFQMPSEELGDYLINDVYYKINTTYQKIKEKYLYEPPHDIFWRDEYFMDDTFRSICFEPEISNLRLEQLLHQLFEDHGYCAVEQAFYFCRDHVRLPLLKFFLEKELAEFKDIVDIPENDDLSFESILRQVADYGELWTSTEIDYCDMVDVAECSGKI